MHQLLFNGEDMQINTLFTQLSIAAVKW